MAKVAWLYRYGLYSHGAYSRGRCRYDPYDDDENVRGATRERAGLAYIDCRARGTVTARMEK